MKSSLFFNNLLIAYFCNLQIFSISSIGCVENIEPISICHLGIFLSKEKVCTANPKRLGAKTLFATHYHELSTMEDKLPNVKNYNIAVKKRGDQMIFLRKIVPGATDDSFGIEVAKLAGIPNAVISRAREILAELESGQREVVAAPVKEADDQISMMDMRGQDICAELEKITLETLTPIEAMNELYRLKKMLN